MAQIRQKKTARERLQEQRQKELEAERSQKFRQRLMLVRMSVQPISLLHGMQIFYCGYCGKLMALYSLSPISQGKKLPPLFYACADRCASSSYHRADFVDRLALELIQQRITASFEKPSGAGDFQGLMNKFRELEQLQAQRVELLNKMHYAAYTRDKVLVEMQAVKDKIEETQQYIHSLFAVGIEENPMIYPLFETAPEELPNFDLPYCRELVRLCIQRIRFYNEYLIVRVNPLTDEDRAKGDDVGRTFNINLRFTGGRERSELPDAKDVEAIDVERLYPDVSSEISLSVEDADAEIVWDNEQT